MKRRGKIFALVPCFLTALSAGVIQWVDGAATQGDMIP